MFYSYFAWDEWVVMGPTLQLEMDFENEALWKGTRFHAYRRVDVMAKGEVWDC